MCSLIPSICHTYPPSATGLVQSMYSCLFFKIVLNVSFEATETYFHKNVYTSDVKKRTFERLARLFLCFMDI